MVNNFQYSFKLSGWRRFLITLPMGQFIPCSQQPAKKDRKLPRGIFYRQFHQEGIKCIFISCLPLFFLEQAKQFGSGNQDISGDLPEVRHFCLETQSLCATHTPCGSLLVLAVQLQHTAKAQRGLNTMCIYFGVNSWLFLDENRMRHTKPPGLSMHPTLFPQSGQLQHRLQTGQGKEEPPASSLTHTENHSQTGRGK